MSGRDHRTTRRLVITMLVVHALSLAGLSTSQAAAANSPAGGLVNDMPCNDFCKAYMAWSDRTMARLNPARRQAPPRPPAAVHARKTEQTPHHAVAAARRPGLNALARLPRQIEPAPPPADPPPVEVAASQPTDPIAELTAAADGVAEQRAGTSSVASVSAEAMPAPADDPLAAIQEPVTTGQVANGPSRRFPVSLALALCALLAFGCWWWIRDTQAADAVESYPESADAA